MYPMAVYAIVISMLQYTMAVHRRFISLLAYPTAVYVHYWHKQLSSLLVAVQPSSRHSPSEANFTQIRPQFLVSSACFECRHIGCRFLLWWILNVARARCRVEFLSASNRPELFVLVPPLIVSVSKSYVCQNEITANIPNGCLHK